MPRILTPERRDAVVLHLLGNALQALDEDSQENRRRVARHWIERATEVLRETAYLDPSTPKAEEAGCRSRAEQDCAQDEPPPGKHQPLTP